MIRFRSSLTILVLLAPALLPAGTLHAGEARLYVVPQFAATRLTGEAQASDDLIEGSDLDLQETLDVDRNVRMPGIEGFASILAARVSFSHFEAEAEGTARLNDLIVFDGEPFLPGERVDTSIEMRRSKLLFGYELGLKFVTIGFMGGAHLVDLEATIEASGHGETEDIRLPIPAVGVSVGVHPLSWLSFHSELSGLSLTISDVRARLLDGFAGVDFLAMSKVGVSIGYRYFLLDVEDEDEGDSMELAQSGAYAGISLHL